MTDPPLSPAFLRCDDVADSEGVWRRIEGMLSEAQDALDALGVISTTLASLQGRVIAGDQGRFAQIGAAHRAAASAAMQLEAQLERLRVITR